MKPIRRNRNFDRKTHKICIKCRKPKARQDIVDPSSGLVLEKKGFGDHNSSDGLQSICHECKNLANTAAREKNVSARIRHHTATRCLTQLGELAPETFTADMESYLGYKITALVKALRKDLKEREGPKRKLRDALNEGYHIDHKRPLSSFNVIMQDAFVDWDEFKLCWAIENLRAIPSAENLAKGAKLEVPTEDSEAPIPTSQSGDESEVD